MRTKYTKEAIKAAVSQSTSVSGVVRLFGRKLAGGNISYMKSIIQHYGIDTSHFLGQGSNCGVDHRGGPEKLPWRKVLVYNRLNGHREKITRLRRAMIESGIKYVCGSCKLGPNWKGKKLVLQMDHKNGDGVDNRKRNLWFLCPNCHSQTKTWGYKNRASGGTKGRRTALRTP